MATLLEYTAKNSEFTIQLIIPQIKFYAFVLCQPMTKLLNKYKERNESEMIT